MIDNKKAVNQLGMMIFLTIITQVFMLLKGSLIAAKFGVGVDLDAFNFANSIGGFAYSFIGSGISTVLVPNLADKHRKKSINIFITVLYSVTFLIFILMLLFRKPLITMLSGSHENYFLVVCSNVFIFTLVSGFLTSFLGLVNGVLQYKGQFNRLKIVTLFTTIMLFLLLLFSEANIYYYAISVLITTLINTIMHLYFLRKSGFTYSVDFNIKEKHFIEMIKLFIPTVLSSGLYQVSLVIDTLISSRLGEGQISLLNYTNIIISMINMLFLGNIVAFMYPRLINNSRDNKCQDTLSNYLILVNALMCILVVLFFIVGKEGISILFERGSFNSVDTNIVYLCSIIYILSLPTNAMRDLIYKYFYINNDTYTPFKNSIIVSVINIVVSVILSKYIGLYGIVIGTVVGSYTSLIMIAIRFGKTFSIKFKGKVFLFENTKTIIITVVTAIVAIVIENNFVINNKLISIVVYSFITALIWGGLLFIGKSKVLKVKL